MTPTLAHCFSGPMDAHTHKATLFVASRGEATEFTDALCSTLMRDATAGGCTPNPDNFSWEAVWPDEDRMLLFGRLSCGPDVGRIIPQPAS